MRSSQKLLLPLLLIAGLLLLCDAHAAKVLVRWTNPSTNTDGSALTNLASVTVQWGSCNGTAFGTLQNSTTLNTTLTGATQSTWAYPVGLNPVCVRAFATNSAGGNSAYSNVAEWIPPLAPGQPAPLGDILFVPFHCTRGIAHVTQRTSEVRTPCAGHSARRNRSRDRVLRTVADDAAVWTGRSNRLRRHLVTLDSQELRGG